jgi:hypothetical protein
LILSLGGRREVPDKDEILSFFHRSKQRKAKEDDVGMAVQGRDNGAGLRILKSARLLTGKWG